MIPWMSPEIQAQGMSRSHTHRTPTLSSFLPSSLSSQVTPKPDILRVFEGYCLSQTAAAVTPTNNKAAKLFSQADRPQQEMKRCRELKMTNTSSLMNKNMNLFGLQYMHAFLLN